MAAIAVNIDTLNMVREGIRNYCSYQDVQMGEADFAIKSMLSSDWLGADAKEFDKKWAGVCDKDSKAAKLKDSLLDFGDLIAKCANEYRAAQATAIDEGVRLVTNLVTSGLPY